MESIRVLPGIGPKKAELFARLGIETTDDLLHFYPRDYEDRTKLLPIASLEADVPACFVASVVSNPLTHRIPKPGNRALNVTKVTVADHTGRLNLTFFNAEYTAQLVPQAAPGGRAAPCFVIQRRERAGKIVQRHCGKPQHHHPAHPAEQRGSECDKRCRRCLYLGGFIRCVHFPTPPFQNSGA